VAAQPIRTYALALWGAQKTIAWKLGRTDLRQLSLEMRVTLIVVDLSLALIIQALVNIGAVTDAQVQAKMAEISGYNYNKLPDYVPPPNEDEGYDPPDPDLGS
jgi:hypothetical protein